MKWGRREGKGKRQEGKGKGRRGGKREGGKGNERKGRGEEEGSRKGKERKGRKREGDGRRITCLLQEGQVQKMQKVEEEWQVEGETHNPTLFPLRNSSRD